MNVVDSSAWLEYFANTANGQVFAKIINQPSQVLVSTVNIYEVFKRILQERTDHDAFYAVAIMMESRVIELDVQMSLEAVLLSRQFKLPFADSILLATARAYEATFWTQDAHFAGIDGVQYIPKP
jgi:predicted nucleic acid-binding protein